MINPNRYAQADGLPPQSRKCYHNDYETDYKRLKHILCPNRLLPECLLSCKRKVKPDYNNDQSVTEETVECIEGYRGIDREEDWQTIEDELTIGTTAWND